MTLLSSAENLHVGLFKPLLADWWVHPNFVKGGLSSWPMETIILLQVSSNENYFAIIDSNGCASKAHGKSIIVISSTE